MSRIDRQLQPHWLCAVVAVVTAGIGDPSAADPRSDYLMHCAGCHLSDASGAPPFVPALAQYLGPLVASDAGRDYIARVPGAAQAPISDAALAEVFNWLLNEYNRSTLPADFRPLSAEEVGRSRAQVLADPLKLRRELWPDYSP